MNKIINLLLLVIVACACWWGITTIMALFNMPAQIIGVVQVLLVLFAVLGVVNIVRGGYKPFFVKGD